MGETILLGNRYRLEERKGSGGMAVVYRAYDTMLDRPVALKILRKDYSNSPEFRERFHHEAKAAAKLSHANIVTVHDFGLDAGRLYIVMEYVPGVDLKTLLRQRGRLPLELALKLIIQACAGIGHAHRSGLVHCDVKPQNMLITEDNLLKVVDFGIARALSTIPSDEKSDVVWGSPLYFSPEQAAGQAPSPASDVYSLGVVLYETITGRPPFTGVTPQELARMHREELPPSPRKYLVDIPQSIEEILFKVLSKEPSARYRTADQFGHVLSRVFAEIFTPSAAEETLHPFIELPSPRRTRGAYATRAQPPQYSKPVPPTSGDALARALPKSHAPSTDIDWFTWVLAFLATIFIGGLIPFWLWVYFALRFP